MDVEEGQSLQSAKRQSKTFVKCNFKETLKYLILGCMVIVCVSNMAFAFYKIISDQVVTPEQQLMFSQVQGSLSNLNKDLGMLQTLSYNFEQNNRILGLRRQRPRFQMNINITRNNQMNQKLLDIEPGSEIEIKLDNGNQTQENL